MTKQIIRKFWQQMNHHETAEYDEQDGFVVEFSRMNLRNRPDLGKLNIWYQGDDEWNLLFQESDEYNAMKGTRDDMLHRENVKHRVADKDIRWD